MQNTSDIYISHATTQIRIAGCDQFIQVWRIWKNSDMYDQFEAVIKHSSETHSPAFNT